MSAETVPTTDSPAADFPPPLLRLVHQPFLFASKSYGDELVLHFGERKADPPRKVKWGVFQYVYGTYSLHTRGSEWVIEGVGGAATNQGYDDTLPFEELRAAAEAALAPGSRVTAAVPFPVDRPNVVGYGLRVELSNGAAVTIIPTPDDDPDATAPDGTPLPQLADWELNTPEAELAVYPGREVRVTPRGP